MTAKSLHEIERLLNRMERALDYGEASKHNRLVYCLVCHDYEVEYVGHRSGEIHRIDCSDEHYEHHLVATQEETSLHGAVEALEWVLGRVDEEAGGDDG